MSGKGGDIGAVARDRQVWLLGGSNPSADKSVGWDDDPFPNLSDPDVLIVNLTTLTEQVLERIGKAKLDQAQALIRDKILNRGTVVAITQPFFSVNPNRTLSGDTPYSDSAPQLGDSPAYSNYHIFPTQLLTKSVPDGGVIEINPNHNFKSYLDNVRRFSFYIENYSPKTILKASETSHKINLAIVKRQEVKDNSGHDLGLTLTPKSIDIYGGTFHYEASGQLVFLPPPTEPIDSAIGRILSSFRKSSPRAEAPPEWAEQISLGRAGEYMAKAAKLKENKAKIQDEIDGLELEASEILAHRRLLYSKGPELEDAVVRAFEALGFGDIRRMGGADEEDAAFDMGGSSTPYSHGVIEVKGTDRGIQLQHILQCNRWTDQHAIASDRPSKGIFVPNQHRLEPYPESSEARMNIEPNQLEQAEMKDICIIPSCTLFEAVRRVLSGKAQDRAKTEVKIAASKGVLKDVS